LSLAFNIVICSQMDWIFVSIKALQGLVFIYDIITYPIYWLVQRPDKVLKNATKQSAIKVEESENSITFRNPAEVSEIFLQFTKNKIDTLDKAFKFAVAQHGRRSAIGSRDLIAEEDEVQPNGRIFKKFVLGDYRWRTFIDMDVDVDNFGRGLAELGVTDRERVVIFSETRVEWLVATFGCLRRGMTCVTLYANLGEEAIIHGINETDTETIITSHELLPKFHQILRMTPKVKNVIVFEGQLKPLSFVDFNKEVKFSRYTDVIELGSKSTKAGTWPSANDIAIIMYTSGSTGTPKGVMMTHKNIISALMSYTNVVSKMFNNDVYMAYLPLAHVLELIAGVEITTKLILDRIYKNITEKVEKGGQFSKGLFNYAISYKEKWYQKGFDTPILNSIIFRSIRSLLGGNVRFLLSGGAPLAPENHSFVRAALCAPILQGYGLTETSSGACIMDIEDRSVGKVGSPLVCCDIKLVSWEEGGYLVSDKPSPRGEIHVGGDNVALGYFKQKEKTREDFYEENGRRWFKTGDIGVVHEDGTFQIIDRKKDLVKLQAGEYISLGKVESELKGCPLVENICVYADPRHSYPVALILPNAKKLNEIAAQENGAPKLENLCKNKVVEKEVLKLLQEYAKKRNLEKFEIPQAMRLCSEPWTPDSGLVTAAFKLKRKNIEDLYRQEIEDMYKKKF
ncbi:hypothetical protein QYM36_008277, partial [Artemia franciscana]